MEASCALFFYFVETMTNDRFTVEFCVISMEVMHVLDCVHMLDVPAGRSIRNIMMNKFGTPFKPFERSMFARSPDLFLKKIGTQYVRQMLRGSLSVETYV